MENPIADLTLLLNEIGSEENVTAIEEEIAKSIEEAIKNKLFFSLPTNEIIKIIQKK
jgi:hypothetical protein